MRRHPGIDRLQLTIVFTSESLLGREGVVFEGGQFLRAKVFFVFWGMHVCNARISIITAREEASADGKLRNAAAAS